MDVGHKRSLTSVLAVKKNYQKKKKKYIETMRKFFY
jgi:hypothetical protein